MARAYDLWKDPDHYPGAPVDSPQGWGRDGGGGSCGEDVPGTPTSERVIDGDGNRRGIRAPPAPRLSLVGAGGGVGVMVPDVHRHRFHGASRAEALRLCL